MKGFTLIELLLAVGILAIVSVFGFINLFGYREAQDLDSTTREIVIILRNAQDRSISQESNNRFGVHFENPASGQGFYDLFSGTNYVSGVIISKFALRQDVQFSDPAGGNSKDVIFSPVTGLPNASTTIIISLKRDSSVSKTITVNSNGQIQY